MNLLRKFFRAHPLRKQVRAPRRNAHQRGWNVTVPAPRHTPGTSQSAA